MTGAGTPVFRDNYHLKQMTAEVLCWSGDLRSSHISVVALRRGFDEKKCR